MSITYKIVVFEAKSNLKVGTRPSRYIPDTNYQHEWYVKYSRTHLPLSPLSVWVAFRRRSNQADGAPDEHDTMCRPFLPSGLWSSRSQSTSQSWGSTRLCSASLGSKNPRCLPRSSYHCRAEVQTPGARVLSYHPSLLLLPPPY